MNLIIKVRELSTIQEQQDEGNIYKGLAYVTEEVGELSNSLLSGNLHSAKTEALDVVVAALSMFYRLGGSKELLKQHTEAALNKWERNL